MGFTLDHFNRHCGRHLGLLETLTDKTHIYRASNWDKYLNAIGNSHRSSKNGCSQLGWSKMEHELRGQVKNRTEN